MFDNPTVLIGAIQLILTICGTLAAVAWRSGKISEALGAKITQSELNMKLALREAIEESNKEIDDRIDKQVRHFGEAILAARQQTTDLAFYVRDHFIPKDEMKDMLKALTEKLDKYTHKDKP